MKNPLFYPLGVRERYDPYILLRKSATSINLTFKLKILYYINIIYILYKVILFNFNKKNKFIKKFVIYL